MAMGAKTSTTSVKPKEMRCWPKVKRLHKLHCGIAVPGPQGTRDCPQLQKTEAELIKGEVKTKIVERLIINLKVFFIYLII